MENQNQNQKNDNIGMKKLKQEAKKILITIGMQLLVIALPIIIFLFAVSLFTWYINIDEGTWKENEKGRPSTYTKTAQISGTEGINVDKDDLITQALLDLDFTHEEIANLTEADIIRILDMSDKLEKTVTSLKDLTHAEIMWCTNSVYSKYLEKPENLQKLLDAELITQYPRIEGLSADKLNGIVEFIRYYTDPDTQVETVTTLKWIDEDQFKIKLEEYDQTGNTDVLNYFTLDGDGNIKIAIWERQLGQFYSNDTTSQTNRKKIKGGVTPAEITSNYDSRYVVHKNDSTSIEATFDDYIVKEQVINYKQMIQKYTLPFEYLWSLLVITESEDFVLELSELAYNSEIKIGIYDNVNKVVTENIEYYREEFREKTEEYLQTDSTGEFVYQGQDPSDRDWRTEEYDYEIKDIRTTYTNSIQCEVLYANTWIVEVSAEYENTIEQQPRITETNPIADEDWSDDISPNPTTTSWTDYYTFTLPSGQEYKRKGDTHQKRLYKYKRTVNREYVTNTDTTISKYVKLPSNPPREKTDRDPNTDNNFIKIALADENAMTAFGNLGSVKWLMGILERNSDTVNMINITKHLLYILTQNKDYDVNFDFSIYETEGFEFVFAGTGAEGGLSLTTTMFEKEIFIRALEEYYNKKPNQNFYNNFLLNAEEIYDASIKNNINPELVVITARAEGNFAEAGGSYNYWGIGVKNGQKKGYNYSSLSNGIAAYANLIHQYESGSKAALIMERYNQRKAAGCDPLGYGLPGTLSGMQSIYSSLGRHVYGSAGTGGYYYMDPARAGVTDIYSTHDEFLIKCKDSGDPEHAEGTMTTAWEQGQYTAWQVKQKLKYWDEIFGDFGDRSTISGSVDLGDGTGAIGGTENSLGGRIQYTCGTTAETTFTVGGRTYINYKQYVGSNSNWSGWCSWTALAIVCTGYGLDVTPEDVRNQIGAGSFNGQSLGKMLGTTSNYEYSNIKEGAINQLKNGKPVIVHVPANSGRWNTDSGHFFTLLSISEDGSQIYVSDPGGYYVGKGRNGWISIDTIFDSSNAIDKYIRF